MAQESDFVTIALPKEVIERIDKCVEQSDGLYLSRPHVVKLALSKFFDNGGKC